MSLADYKGPANSREMFQHLVGERITAVFREGHRIYLVLGSGVALGMTSFGGECSPAFFVIAADEWQRAVKRRQEEIGQAIAQLQELTW